MPHQRPKRSKTHVAPATVTHESRPPRVPRHTSSTQPSSRPGIRVVRFWFNACVCDVFSFVKLRRISCQCGCGSVCVCVCLPTGCSNVSCVYVVVVRLCACSFIVVFLCMSTQRLHVFCLERDQFRELCLLVIVWFSMFRTRGCWCVWRVCRFMLCVFIWCVSVSNLCVSVVVCLMCVVCLCLGDLL